MSESAGTAPAIEVTNARKVFNGVEAVADVSFTVPESSFTTLLGASGSGKTTVLRLLAGLERLDGGAIAIRSTRVASAQPFVHVPPEGRRVGFVFQTYALWPHMTVFDQVAYPLRVRRQRTAIREKVDAALASVDLSGLGHRYPSELSGGQQQRVALARALVYEPTVLLLDEPLSNLDAELREHMRNELQSLHRRLKVTMVYVTHDQSEALSLSDQVILMHKGRIIDRGSPRTVYERPSNFESSRFIGASNNFHGAALSGGLSVALDCGVTVAVDGSRLAQPLRAGDRVALSIKPEDVLIASAGEGGANHYQLRVESLAFVGPHQDVTLDLGGSRLRVRMPKHPALEVGALVDVEWPPAMIGVFAGESERGA